LKVELEEKERRDADLSGENVGSLSFPSSLSLRSSVYKEQHMEDQLVIIVYISSSYEMEDSLITNTGMFPAIVEGEKVGGGGGREGRGSCRRKCC